MTYPANAILGAVLGSHAQGFATPESDTDYGCVFVTPFDDLALTGFREPRQSIQEHEPDIWGHELGKFCRLAMGCHPNPLELLFTPNHDLVTHAGQLLVDNRDAFLSFNRVVNAYQGYAQSQVSRALKDGSIKPRRHALRLLWQCRETIRTGTVPVTTPTNVRVMIMSAVQSDDHFLTMSSDLRQDITVAAAGKSPLPDYPDEERIETIIRAIRRASR